MSLKAWFEKTFPQYPLSYEGKDAQGFEHYRASAAVPLRAAPIRSAPSRDEFKAWRNDPTTRFVMQALRTAAETQREAWIGQSWESQKADPLALKEFRTRADAYASMEEGSYEDFCRWAGVEPEKEQAA